MNHSARSALLLCAILMSYASLCLGQSPLQASTGEVTAAVVNGRTITQAEVDETITSSLFALQQQIYAIRKAALENLISHALLDEEARKRGISFEELKLQMTSGKVEITAAQVEQIYSENSSAFAAISPDEVRLRLRFDLETQARMQNYREALSRLRKTSQIRWLMKEPRLPVVADVNAPTVGPAEAPVTIVEFSDFQCPFCRNAQSVISQILKHYKSEVRLVFKHLPLEIHSEAFISAQAAFCAGEQGAFWRYHDALFLSEDLSPEALSQLATKLHLNPNQFGDCLKSDSARLAVQKNLNEAKKLGIDSTPTFVINGKLFRGALSFEDFKAAVDQELKSSR